MPIIFLEAENVIDRIHRSSVISYRNIIKKWMLTRLSTQERRCLTLRPPTW